MLAELSDLASDRDQQVIQDMQQRSAQAWFALAIQWQVAGAHAFVG
jgi:hypothetical protein